MRVWWDLIAIFEKLMWFLAKKTRNNNQPWNMLPTVTKRVADPPGIPLLPLTAHTDWFPTYLSCGGIKVFYPHHSRRFVPGASPRLLYLFYLVALLALHRSAHSSTVSKRYFRGGINLRGEEFSCSLGGRDEKNSIIEVFFWVWRDCMRCRF